MGLLTARGTAAAHVAAAALPGGAFDAFSTFDLTGGRIGSGARGSGQGGLAGCRR